MATEAVALGQVIRCTGTRVTGLLERRSIGKDRPIRVGDLVRMHTSGAEVYGVIDVLDASVPETGPLAEIDLLGQALITPQGVGRFQLGVSAHPGLGDQILTTTAEDATKIYSRPGVTSIRLGSLYQDAALPALVATDDLLNKHFAILGTTGSGKSCTVALILRRVLEANPAGHILLLDPHNEYSQAFGDQAEVISPANLQLPLWLLNFEESVEVLVSKEGADRQAQITILKEAILDVRRSYAKEGEDTKHITVDTPSPYRLSELLRTLNNNMGKLDKPENSIPYLRLLGRLESLSNDRRFGFMFSGVMVRDTLAEVLSRMFRIPVRGKPITIFDLSAVPSEIVDVVVSVLCRMMFDFALWSAQGQTVPLLLVCEEAHRYAPEQDELGFGPTKRAIARIAKEGRKYGVSVGLISQRPSELATTIVSQCGTIFALRMGNERDQAFVQRVLPEGAQGLLRSLPTLRPQEAVVVGVAAAVPMRITFDDLPPEFRPRSDSAHFSDLWQRDCADGLFVEQTVSRWRHQKR
ncbi:Helicase HerA central domain-containing protein [uncultured Gammaproteobacteria bacterium]